MYALKEEIKKCEYCKDWIECDICRMIVNDNKRIYLHNYCFIYLEKILLKEILS